MILSKKEKFIVCPICKINRHDWNIMDNGICKKCNYNLEKKISEKVYKKIKSEKVSEDNIDQIIINEIEQGMSHSEDFHKHYLKERIKTMIKEKELSVCSVCNRKKKVHNILNNGVCKGCNKKIQDGKIFKICPICGEKIKYTAIKCRFCNEYLDDNKKEDIGPEDKVAAESPRKESDNKNTNSDKDVFIEPKKNINPTVSFVFGLLSIFLSEFSIFPILAIIFGFISVSKYNDLSNRDKAFSIIGFVLGIIYLIASIYFYNYSY